MRLVRSDVRVRKMKEVYFDNSATTACSEGVIRIVSEVMRDAYGNPSSMHMMGVEAEKYCKNAAQTLADLLKVSPDEILFTSGGTESNNLAIKGAAYAYQRLGRHIITTQVEHPSVYNVTAQLEKEGFEVSYLPVNAEGIVEPQSYLNALRADTILTSIMTVNNEIGSRQPVEELAKIKNDNNPDSIFHTDAVQAFSKYRIYPAKAGIDLLSVSGHKFHAPKGVGALYIRKGVRVIPQILGGGQQHAMRSGTHPVPQIAGLGLAAAEAYTDFENKISHLCGLREYMIDALMKIEGVVLIGPSKENSAPHIVSAAFPPVRSEVLLHALEDKGIYVSSGSACSSNSAEASKTIRAIGIGKPLSDSVIRFSFCNTNTFEEIEYCIEMLKALLPILKKYARR